MSDIKNLASVQKSLRERDLRYRALFNGMRNGFAYHKIILDDKGVPVDYEFLELNEAFEKHTNLSREKIIGKRATEVIPAIAGPDSDVDLIAEFGKVAMTGDGRKFEAYSDGLKKWFSISAFSEKRGFFGVTFEDITERKRAEKELLRAKEEWERTFDTVPDLIAILNDQHRIVRVNRAMADRLGVTPDECIGLRCYEAVHATSEPPEFCPHTLTCRDGQQHVAEVHEPRLGGYFLVSTTPLFGLGKDIVGTVHVARDITDRKRAEEALGESEEKFRAIFEQARDGIVLTDYDSGTMVDCNAEFERQTGRKINELRSMKVWEIRPPEMVEGSKKKFLEVREKGEVASSDLGFLRPDGGVIPIDFVSKVVTIGGKKYLQGITRDITDRKRAEEELKKHRLHLEELVQERTTELERANEELLKAQKLESLGVLAGGIAHDFNNALSAIMNHITIAKMSLESKADIEKAQEMLEAAAIAVQRATAMPYQLMTFAKGGEPVRKTVSLGRLVRDTVHFSLRGSKVDSTVHVDDNLWFAHVDEGQIAQVISNLVINADQSMPKGGTIDVSAENVTIEKAGNPHLRAGRYIRLTVKDRGHGIPKDYIQKIFDPYFTTKQRGSGLGLASSYSIVRKHEGHIAVKSTVGDGTTFHVYLPATHVEPSVVEEEREKPTAGGGRILILEDDAVIGSSLVLALEESGFEAEHAQDGAETIELYEKAKEAGRPFDVVMMDLTIAGGMGGVETAKKLCEIDHEVKSVVTSGYSNDPVMANFREYGFVDVIAKPYEIWDLTKLLHEVIAGKSSSR